MVHNDNSVALQLFEFKNTFIIWTFNHQGKLLYDAFVQEKFKQMHLISSNCFSCNLIECASQKHRTNYIQLIFAKSNYTNTSFMHLTF